MDWERFLPLARCPECRGRISRGYARIGCANGHAVTTSAAGVPLFAPPPRPLSAREAEDRRRHAHAYAGMNAYGYMVIGSGHAEGLYRTISDLLLRSLPAERELRLLEVGCGAGRCVRDLAAYLDRAFVVGVDRDEVALDLAHAALIAGGGPLVLNLRGIGFGERTLPRWQLANLFLAQGLVDRLPLATPDEGGGFDAILNVNLLDRVPDPEAALGAMVALLRPGGVLLTADPLDWWQSDGALWDRYGHGMAGILEQLHAHGLEVETAFDGIVYRELNDARGSYTDWPVAVVLARRAHDG